MVKHGNPVGLACGDDLAETYRRALAGDPTPRSAVPRPQPDRRRGDRPRDRRGLLRGSIAPDYTPEALTILQKKRDLEIIDRLPPAARRARGRRPRLQAGGRRLARADPRRPAGEHADARVVTTRQPTLSELTSLLFGWRAVARPLARDCAGERTPARRPGAGQPSRVDAVDLACARPATRAAVMASDAFFPFPDGIERAAAGVTAVIQPGGSTRDQQAIEVADRHHMAMIFTHQRHFKH